MCGKVCAEICADARMAETAMSALPFSTVELEQIRGFLGVTGDYAYTLLDISHPMPHDTVERLKEINGVIRVRRIVENK